MRIGSGLVPLILHAVANVAADLATSCRSRTMPSTGDTCQTSGKYKCSTHTSNTIPLSKGEKFPPCGRDGGHSATWILVEPI
jgi:hypothetical protein